MDPLRILFIGNSHTYLHKMPWILCELAAAHGGVRTVKANQSTGNGVSLEWHWQNREMRARIAEGGWDFVVLQERSKGTIEDPESFYRYARLLNTEILRQGARTVFYMTWAGRDRPEDQATIADAYRRAAKDCGARLAPVGTAWRRALTQDPGCALYHRDGRHAGPAGAYLTACIFFALLFSISPLGLPGTIYTKGKLRVELSPQQAGFLQRIAFEAVAG